MDTPTLTAALMAAGLDEMSIEPFLAMVVEAHQAIEDKDSFDSFKEKLNQQPDLPLERELFLRCLEDTERMEVIRYLVELGPDQTKAAWESARAAQQDAENNGDADWPNRAEFAADLQTYCGYWDRTDEGWQAFADVFQDYAETTHGPIATDFFDRATNGEDKHALFADYGVTFDDADGPEDSTAEEDTSADNEVLRETGEQFAYLWAGFDGTREGWDQSRDWTYTAVNDVSPSRYATLYEAFQALEEQPMPERITQLNEWGFAITVTGAQDEDATYSAMAALLDEETAAAVLGAAQEAVAEVNLPDTASTQLAELFAQELADDPELQGLTPQQHRELMVEIAQAAATATTPA